MSKTALITGITGQDGSFLAEFLLKKKYKVHGLIRRTSSPNFSRIQHILDKIELHQGDITDQGSISEIIKKVQPDEVYHLAAQSFVAASWNQPHQTITSNVLGTLNTLDAIRQIKPDTKFYNAASSEMFGKVLETPQKETTPFYPRSPYGVSKVASYYMTVNYRESYDMFAVNGILFNHEGTRRGIEFVTRKISHAVARIKLGLQKELVLGNLDAKRDWGNAKDYVRAMWMMLQRKKPTDYVIATGETHTVREFCQIAFNRVGLNWKDYVRVDEKFKRPAEVNILQGNSSKARRQLGWKPKYSFQDLVYEMVDSDMKLVRKELKK